MMCLFVVLIPFLGISQTDPATDYYLQHFNSDFGLPLNGIKRAAYDKNTHYLWIATDGGLVRYDGKTLKVFNKSTYPSIESERTTYITQNNKNEIYVGNEWGYIFKITENAFARLNTSIIPSSIKENKQQELLQISEHIYNAVKYNSSILDYTTPYVTFSSVDSSSFYGLDIKGIAFYNSLTGKKQIFNKQLGDSVIGMCKLNHQTIYLNKKGEFNSVTIKDFKVSVASLKASLGFEIQKNAQLIWKEGKDNTLLLNQNKLYVLAEKNGIINATCLLSEIPIGIEVRDMIYLPENNQIFIFTVSDGFFEYRKKQLLPSDKIPNTGGYGKYVLSQYLLNDSTIITNDLDVFGNKKIAKLPFSQPFDYIIKRLKDGTIWFTHRNDSSLLSYSPISKTTTPRYTNHGIIRFVFEENNDSIFLIGNEGIRYFTSDKTGLLSKFNRKQSETIFPSDIVLLNNGKALIGTNRGLLKVNLYNSNEMDTLLATEGTIVRTIHPYKNYFILGTYGMGIFIYDGFRVRPIPLDKEKNLLFAHCFVEDNQGHCWISSNKGLYEVLLDDMIAAFKDTTLTTIYYHHYSKEDGMRISELNGGCLPCAIKLKDNTISFPSVQGPLWVKPNEIKPVLPKGKIFIDETFANNDIANLNDSIATLLPTETNQVKVLLSIPNWGSTDNLYIYYKLDNQPLELLTASENFKITLNNLSSGTHKLSITKLNGFGENNFERKILLFTIDTPWYFKWWFILISASILMLFIWLIIHARTKAILYEQARLEGIVVNKTRELNERNLILEKNDKIKTRLISIISHDIISPLKFINMSSKNLAQSRNLISEELLTNSLFSIAETSQELQVLSTNILNWIKYQHQERMMMSETFNLFDLVEQVIKMITPVSSPKNITLLNKVSTNQEFKQYKEPIRIIIYNLVLNAVHFTNQEGRIEISCFLGNSKINITVLDNGIGMTKEQSKNILSRDFIVSSTNVDDKRGSGLGYLIIRDLLKIIKADITIQSKLKKGTSVSISWIDFINK